ncbi:MAG: structural cement protein Gp24 [Pseudomonadota bacterium]
MPVLQSTYTDDLALGYPGMIASGETSNRITRTVADAAGVAFGRAVYRGTGDHECTATVGTLATFLGFTVATSALQAVEGQTVDRYQQRDNATILTSGAMFVTVTGNVADGAAITVATANGSLSSTAADASNIATGWIADQTITGGGLIRIVKR